MQDLRTAYEEWISKYKWTIFATLTFRADLTEKAAKRASARWLFDIKRAFPEACWVRVMEKGSVNERIHFHILLAEVPCTARIRQELKHSWNKIGGIARVDSFREAQSGNAIRYMLKTITQQHIDQIDIEMNQQGVKIARGNRHETSHGTRGCGVSSTQSGNSVSPNFGKENSGDKAESQSSSVPATGFAEMARRKDRSSTVKLPSIKIPCDAGFHVERHGQFLLIALPLNEGRPSKSSGKTNVIGSTGGPRVTFAEQDGKPILVNAIAMVNPTKPLYKQRCDAHLAKWDGKQC